MPPTKRNATNALDPSERNRAQNRISQQCPRKKNLTYLRNLGETIELLQKVATGSDPQDRHSVLLDGHLKLIAENQRLEDALLRLRENLLSFSQAATFGCELVLLCSCDSLAVQSTWGSDDEVFGSIFQRRDQQPVFQNMSEQATPQTYIFKDTWFILDPFMAGQEHETSTSNTVQPDNTF